jgi:maltose O-acetyltransferase
MHTSKVFGKIKEKIVELFFQKPRIIFYKVLSSIKIKAKIVQPLLANGEGSIVIGKDVFFGVRYANDYYSKYGYLNVRKKTSYIEIGDNCRINNNIFIVSDGKRIVLSKNCLIGSNVQIIDSDFHDLNPRRRFGGVDIKKQDIYIGENVFIGNNVTILKGVTVGKNSIVGNGSVVSSDIPENVVAAGNPAKIIRFL